MDGADVISRLPFDLLTSILSRLTLKEAIVTSALSRRWEKLWTYYCGDLKLSEVSKKKFNVKECSNYVRAVSKVLGTLELVESGGVIDSLAIHFHFCPENLRSVASWVRFALEKRMVRRLHFYPIPMFDCCCTTPIFPPFEYFYTQQCNIASLTSIRFWRVNFYFSGGTIEHLLANCPLLESLELRELRLVHVRVSGEALALRHLSICSCPLLTTIEISAPNLISFEYIEYGDALKPLDIKSKNVKFGVLNVPKVAELEIQTAEIPLTVAGRHLLSYFSCIQKFKLYILTKEPDESFNVMKLPSVKHFTMVISGYDCEHILSWTPLLKAFPVLQKFTLNMSRRKEKRIDGVRRDGGDVDDKYFPKECRFKVFEFLGFGELDDDIDLVMYVLKKVVPLEKIIVRCDRGISWFPGPLSPFDSERVEEAVTLAGKLKSIIPKDIDLVVVKPLCTFQP